jgi:FAD/FMN-containing dehydrogenase
MVATDAGGTRVVRHGRMRAQVVGIEAVLADGSVISRLDGPVAGGGGYDVAGLLAGSEGTLAVITAVALRLVPARGAAAVALVGVPGTRAALDVAAAARPLTPDAVEVFYANGLALVCAHTGLRPPLQAAWPAYVLIEVCGDGAHSRLSDLLTSAGAEDAALAESPDDQRRMWAYRERHAEAIAAAGVPHKLDVALPQHRLAEFVDAVAPLVRSHDPAATCVIFGHLGVGNLHVNVLGLPPADDTVDDAVLRLVAELGGSIGAEHGIGVAKARWLPLTRSAADLAAMGAIKRALDPAGLLNPGVLLAADGRAR